MSHDDSTKPQIAEAGNPRRAEAVTEAAWEAALRDCPEDIRRAVAAEPAILRAHPDKVLGRDKELKEIKRHLTKVTKGPRKSTGVKAQAIVGSPGAGKSTMLKQIRLDLEADGTNVIKLVAADVTRPERFSQKVRDHPPWNRQDLWDRIAEAATTSGASVLDDIINTFTTPGLKHLVRIAQILKGIEAEDMGPVTEALRAWREGQTPTMASVMRLLQNTNDRGTVIIIDEGQELASYHRDAPRGEAAAEVLRMMNDPDARAEARVWNVTMLIGGMTDIPEVVKGLTTIRPDPHILDAVPLDAARAMIVNGIDRSQVNEADKARAKTQWVDPLTARYSDWTRHAQCGAEAARIVLDHAGARALDEPWGLALVLDKADAERRELYDEIVTRARDNGVISDLQYVVMRALAANQRRLSETNMIRLVGTWIIDVDQGPQGKLRVMDPEIKAASDQMIRDMNRSGMIAIRDGEYISPIPSLVRYITQTLRTDREEAARIIQKAGLASEDPDGDPADD